MVQLMSYTIWTRGVSNKLISGETIGWNRMGSEIPVSHVLLKNTAPQLTVYHERVVKGRRDLWSLKNASHLLQRKRSRG